jgi:hypothetical protein
MPVNENASIPDILSRSPSSSCLDKNSSISPMALKFLEFNPMWSDSLNNDAALLESQIMKKVSYVSKRTEWDEMFPILAPLWSHMTMQEIKVVVEKTHDFRATFVFLSAFASKCWRRARIDQYKKKFTEWQRKGRLLRKKNRLLRGPKAKDGNKMLGSPSQNLTGEQTENGIRSITLLLRNNFDNMLQQLMRK